MTDSKCLYCGSGQMIYTCPMYCGKCGKKVEGSDTVKYATPERMAVLLEMLKRAPNLAAAEEYERGMTKLKRPT